MTISFRHAVSLKPYNTFAIDAVANRFTELNDLADLPALLASDEYRNDRPFWLGGGSNIVLSGDLERLVIKVGLRGIRLLQQQSDSVIVEAAAGEPWHDFVQYTLAQGWYGLENLSLIPGTVGASPVQNIGAYGVEVKDCLDSVVCADLTANGQRCEIAAADCAFAYRNSVFKHELKERMLITAVRFRLSTQPTPRIDYGDIRRELATMNITGEPTPQQVADAVIALRRSKLPDPAVLGNAGSFFKNPVVDAATASALSTRYPDLPQYPANSGQVKLAAGWLIDHAGLKGYRQGNVGVHERQALVLVNYGDADGDNVIRLAGHIQQTIRQQYGITLEMEPLLIT